MHPDLELSETGKWKVEAVKRTVDHLPKFEIEAPTRREAYIIAQAQCPKGYFVEGVIEVTKDGLPRNI